MVFDVNQDLMTNTYKIGYEKRMQCIDIICLGYNGNRDVYASLYKKELNKYVFGAGLHDPYWLDNPAVSYFGDKHEILATDDKEAIKVFGHYYRQDVRSDCGIVCNMGCAQTTNVL